MLVVAVIAGVAAVVFAALFASARSAAAAAQARGVELQRTVDSLTTDNARLDGELASMGEQAAATAAELATTEAALAEATATGAELAADVETKAGRIAELEGEVEGLADRIEAAETAAASAKARASGIVIGELSDGGARPETLWNLEVTRSERTWRTSVATNPEGDTSPFEVSDDPLRLAVEIEASALRENVGAFITIDWQADPVDDATQRHLILRVAQELLESAARSPEPSMLSVTQDDDGEISLGLSAAEDGDQVINIIPPRITSDLLDFRTDDGEGLSVTVKAAE
ncbi:MAG: hypothetical protein AAGD35_19710 [Actinomycetota bacterium]